MGRGREQTAAPPAPPWQQEIDAARLLEGSLALAPARDARDQETRRRQLQNLYRQLARKYPAEAAVQKAAGSFFARDDQPEAALPFWEEAARIDPRDGDTADLLGGACLRLGRTREAYARFQHAVEASPDVASYHSDLANVLYLFRRDLMSPPVPGFAGRNRPRSRRHSRSSGAPRNSPQRICVSRKPTPRRFTSSPTPTGPRPWPRGRWCSP